LQSHVIKLIQKTNEGEKQLTLLNLTDNEFYSHPVLQETFTPRLEKSIQNLLQKDSRSLTDVLMTENVGSKTIRALSLISELVIGAKPSFEDPARYSFAFGGKDGIPYPVDKITYDKTLNVIEKAIKKAQLSPQEKDEALRRMEENIKI
jgi:hypothetical protein